MLEPDHALMSRALGTTRYETSIVTTKSINDNNVKEETNSAGTKRKRPSCRAEESWKDTFSIRPYPSSVYAKPQELLPLLVTSRLSISLAYLDPAAKSSLPTSRLFSGNIKALHGSRWDRPGSEGPALLVARLINDGSVHVLEEVEAKVYACCKIGDWVKLETLQENAWAVRSYDHTEEKDSIKPGTKNRDIKSTDFQVLGGHECMPNKRKKLERSESIQMLMRKRPQNPLMPTPPPSDNLESGTNAKEPKRIDFSVTEALANAESVESSPTTILETIRDQYLDALYASNASLAYFAKGPLSRARAACSNKETNSFGQMELSNLLQSLIYPLAVLEKKHNSTLPTIVQDIAPGLPSDDEEAEHSQSTKSPPKSREIPKKQKKFKIGKNGLHLQEPKLLEHWWKSPNVDMHSSLPAESRDQEVKRRLSSLRVRETQLQIVLILEIMALRVKSEQQTPALGSKIQDQEDSQSKPNKGRSSKQLNLPVLVDLHVDRLTIWQSLRRDNVIQTEDVSASSSRANGPSPEKSLANGINNEFGQFSAEVIIPFFAARVPDKCVSINQSLGGPSLPKNKRSSTRPTKSTDKVPKSENPLQHIRTGSPRKSLSRISTEGRVLKRHNSQSSQAPRLSRSATAPVMTSLKREGSQSSISATSRGPAFKSKAFSRREVDLTATVKTGDKLGKKSSVEAALKEAISTLKAPNRLMAVKDVSQSVDRQAKGTSTNSKQPRKPLKTLSNQSVQVMATPKRHRNTNALLELPMAPESVSPVIMRRPAVPEHQGNHFIPASATKPCVSMVPESSPPSNNAESKDCHPDCTRSIPYLSSVTSTPLALKTGMGRPKTAGGIESITYTASPFSLALPDRNEIHCEAIEETPSKRRLSCGSMLRSSKIFSLSSGHFQTCDTLAMPLEQKETVISSSPPVAETSIYDKLGWDNDDDPF